MLHPHTEIRHVSALIGCGVFATAPIPAGTIVWVPDRLDRHFTRRQVDSWPEDVREATLKYMYRDYRGRYVLSWDHARFVNHSFTPNCIITPLGFTIAIRDIAENAELLEDYGTLNIIEPFKPAPEPGAKRKVVKPDDLVHHSDGWDVLLQEAVSRSGRVTQPLRALMPTAMTKRWRTAIRTPARIPSLRSMFVERDAD
jgi:uncharacterized protein